MQPEGAHPRERQTAKAALAVAQLKKKGVAKADKKAGNQAVEGNVASYVHFNSKAG